MFLHGVDLRLEVGDLGGQREIGGHIEIAGDDRHRIEVGGELARVEGALERVLPARRARMARARMARMAGRRA